MRPLVRIPLILVMSTAGLVLALGALPGCRDLPGSTRLELDPDEAPYALDIVKTNFSADLSDGESTGFVMCDIDGDGRREFVEATGQKLLGGELEDGFPKNRWEEHLAGSFMIDDEDSRFGVCRDFNGDRVEEIYFTAVSKDRLEWRFVVFDPASREFVVNAPLPVGEDRRKPDYWDGSYVACGFIDDADGAGNPAVVLARSSGYDATLRGICAVSPFTGEMIWEFVSGAQPSSRHVVVDDLDGDGKQEIIWGTTSPDNLGGRLVGGITDNRALLVILDSRGRLVLTRELGPMFSRVLVRTADLDGDGTREIITCTANGSIGDNNQLTVWEGSSGKIRATVRREAAFRGVTVLPGPRPGSSWLVTGSNNGSLCRYLFHRDTLVLDRQVLQESDSVCIVGACDFLPSPGPEIFVTIPFPNRLVLVNSALEFLALNTTGKHGAGDRIGIWPGKGPEKVLVVATSKSTWLIKGRANPISLLAVVRWSGAILVLVIGMAGMFLLGRSRGRRDSDIRTHNSSPRLAADRQALFLLYRELADVNHQIVGKAKGLARLLWLLEAYSSEMGASEELEQRIAQVLADFRESVHPILASILKQATDAGFEPDTVGATIPVLNSLARRIDELVVPGLDPARIAAARNDLGREWAQVKNGFLQLHTAITDYFTTDPTRMIRGMLLVRAEEFARAGITAEFTGVQDGEEGPLAGIDSGDLRFVLDNLLDNAIRAMKDVSSGRLVVRLTREGQEISLRVTDSGHGIEPRLHQEIFSSRFSSRHGGGHGLHRSREIMDRWGGEIILADSRPGKGTTFIVKLLAVDGSQGSRTMTARG